MSLLTALIVEKTSHTLAGIYFIILRKHPRPNLKGFQNQIWTSITKSGKKLVSKASFSAFLEMNCSNFRLKLCQRLQSYKNGQINQI